MNAIALREADTASDRSLVGPDDNVLELRLDASTGVDPVHVVACAIAGFAVASVLGGRQFHHVWVRRGRGAVELDTAGHYAHAAVVERGTLHLSTPHRTRNADVGVLVAEFASTLGVEAALNDGRFQRPTRRAPAYVPVPDIEHLTAEEIAAAMAAARDTACGLVWRHRGKVRAVARVLVETDGLTWDDVCANVGPAPKVPMRHCCTRFVTPSAHGQGHGVPRDAVSDMLVEPDRVDALGGLDSGSSDGDDLRAPPPLPRATGVAFDAAATPSAEEADAAPSEENLWIGHRAGTYWAKEYARATELDRAARMLRRLRRGMNHTPKWNRMLRSFPTLHNLMEEEAWNDPESRRRELAQRADPSFIQGLLVGAVNFSEDDWLEFERDREDENEVADEEPVP